MPDAPGPTSRSRLHLWFVLVAGAAGVVLAVIVPPGKPPDEYAHLLRIWSVAHGHAVPDVSAQGDGGSPVAACVTAYSQRMVLNYTSQQPLHLRQMWRSPMPCRGAGRVERPATFGNSAVNSPVTYAPQVLAVVVLDALRQPVSHMILGARLAVLAAYLAMVAVAIRVSPRAKLLLFVLGALPAAVGLASTLSSDGMVLGTALLSVALVLRLRRPGRPADGRGDRAARWALGLTLVALCLAKNSYSPFVLLWLLVPVAPAGNSEGGAAGWRLWARRAGVPAVGLATAALWAVQVRNITRFPPSLVYPDVNPQRQLAWALRHPFGFAGVMWRTLATKEFFGGILPRVVGRYPSGRPGRDLAVHSPPVPPWMLVLMGLTLAVAIAVEVGRRRAGASRWAPLTALAVAVACSGLVLLLVYGASSPVGSPRVMLLQGRYFTPLLPLLAIGLAERWEPAGARGRLLGHATGLVVAGSALVLAGELYVSWTMYFR